MSRHNNLHTVSSNLGVMSQRILKDSCIVERSLDQLLVRGVGVNSNLGVAHSVEQRSNQVNIVHWFLQSQQLAMLCNQVGNAWFSRSRRNILKNTHPTMGRMAVQIV